MSITVGHVVSTAEALPELPERTIIIDFEDCAWQLWRDQWYVAEGGMEPEPNTHHFLRNGPFVVLWLPADDQPNQTYRTIFEEA